MRWYKILQQTCLPKAKELSILSPEPPIAMMGLNYISSDRFQWLGMHIEWSGKSVEFRMNSNGDIQSVAAEGWPFGS
jgi:hypothetical protein